jgi:hypothetical protein
MLTIQTLTNRDYSKRLRVYFDVQIGHVEYYEPSGTFTLYGKDAAGLDILETFDVPARYAPGVIDSFRRASIEGWHIKEFNKDVLEDVFKDGIGAFPL